MPASRRGASPRWACTCPRDLTPGRYYLSTVLKPREPSLCEIGTRCRTGYTHAMDSHDVVALLLLALGCTFLLYLRNKRSRIVRRAFDRATAPVDRSPLEEDDPELLALIARKEEDHALRERGGAYRHKP